MNKLDVDRKLSLTVETKWGVGIILYRSDRVTEYLCRAKVGEGILHEWRAF